METLTELLESRMNQAVVWFFSMWWYWLPAGLGLAFRFGLLKYKIFDSEKRIKAIFRDISIIALLTITWNLLNANQLEDKAVVMILILTMVYIFYGIAKECEDTGGTTESLLLIVKSVFVTVLSFQTFIGTIVGAVCTSILAVLVYKVWYRFEKKTDLFEIIFLCVEAILLSVYTEVNHIEGFLLIFFFVFYEETALFLLNYFSKYMASKFLGEADDYNF